MISDIPSLNHLKYYPITVIFGFQDLHIGPTQYTSSTQATPIKCVDLDDARCQLKLRLLGRYLQCLQYMAGCVTALCNLHDMHSQIHKFGGWGQFYNLFQ